MIKENHTAWLDSPLDCFPWRVGPEIFGKTPPSAIVVLESNLLSYSSFLMANKMCLGTILVFLLSFAALPANSRTSAAKYSRTAAR